MRVGDLYLMEQSTAYPAAKCWCLVVRCSKGGWPGTLVYTYWSDDKYVQRMTITQDHPGAKLVGCNVRPKTS